MIKFYNTVCFKHKKLKSECGCDKIVSPNGENFSVNIKIGEEEATLLFKNKTSETMVNVLLNHLVQIKNKIQEKNKEKPSDNPA